MKTFLTRSTPAALLGAALLLTASATPLFAGQLKGGGDTFGEPEPPPFQIVSPALMDALEDWSTGDTTYAEIAEDMAPGAFIEYGYEVDAVYGMPLAYHFEERYPETYQRYLASGGDETDSPALIDYLMSVEQDIYAQWQKESALLAEEASFDRFIERTHPHIVAEAAMANETPADRGTSIADHLIATDRESLMGELEVLLDGVQSAATNCGCWVALAFSNSPNAWGQIAQPVNTNDSGGWPLQWRKVVNFAANGRGMASNIDYHRWSRRKPHDVRYDINTTYSELSVRMHCTEGGQPGGQQCDAASGCTGELAMRVEFQGRVYENIQSQGLTRGSSATAATSGTLVYNPPGSTPDVTLFEKAVAVSAEHRVDWDPEAITNLLGVAANIGLTYATGGNVGTAISNALDNDLITTVFALIQTVGSEQALTDDVLGRFDTGGSTGLLLQPNMTHVFRLDGNSAVGGSGKGTDSKSWANIDSAFSFAAVGRNYQCAANTTAPTPGGYWSYDQAPNAPISHSTQADNVGDFIQVEYGVRPPAGALSQIEGVYP